MAWFLWCVFMLCIFRVIAVAVDQPRHEEDLANQIGTMKNTIKVLSDQWEKWNTLFITSLEPRITSTASTLSSIDSNVHNLQERAHVWDTFQLHVAAWNEQLASMDRKIDILNKAVEQVTVLDNKMNTMLSEEYKLDKLIKMANSLLESVVNIEAGMKSKQYCKSSSDSLFEEFAVRGILSSLKLVERKVDQLLRTRQSDSARNEEPVGKCTTTISMENLVNDISSKVDIIFDSVSKANENDLSDEYIDAKDVEGSGSAASIPKLTSHRSQTICKGIDEGIKNIADRISNVDKNVLGLLRHYQLHISSQSTSNAITKNEMINALNNFSEIININQTRNVNWILESYFHQDRKQWSLILDNFSKKCCSTNFTPIVNTNYFDEATTPFSESQTITENGYINSDVITTENDFEGELFTPPPKTVYKSSCSDLNLDNLSGIYIFKRSIGDFVKERFFNKQFCEIRDDGLWIVIQRRDNYTKQQDFNVSWHDYKLGFGELQKDFWVGNNFLSRLTSDTEITLRIELEDFDGNNVWAEYKKFKVADEFQQFKLTVGGYSGNSSDAFSSHSGSLFSTYDKKNDDAPDCCSCSVSYGGGWWFNRCFESNLNGVYYKKPFEHDHFRGVIWEHWLGNYSLKKSVMMVKSTGSSQLYSNSKVTKFEDP